MLTYATAVGTELSGHSDAARRKLPYGSPWCRRGFWLMSTLGGERGSEDCSERYACWNLLGRGRIADSHV